MSKKHEKGAGGVSRRGFLKGAGVTVAAVGVTGAAAVAQDSEAEVVILGPGPVDMKLKVNGAVRTVKVPPSATLLDTLRGPLDLTGAKRVCNRGSCGACTVHIDGKTVKSCSMLALDAVGRDIRTIEGLAPEGELTPLQQAFVDCDAMQCGFCTPGMVMSCTALLERNAEPTRDEVRTGIAGNICRCGTYQNIFEAVDQAGGTGEGR